jgi:transposase InsO family protein
MHSIHAAAKLLGITPQAVRRQCVSGKLPGAVKQGGCWKIPETADVKLCTGRVVGSKVDADEFRAIPADKRDDALRKLGVIQAAESYCGLAVRNGGLRSEAMTIFCDREQISPASIKRWLKAYRERGLVGLVDQRGGGEGETISPEAWLYFKGLYLDQRRPTIRHCLKLLTFINKSERRGWIVPSYKSLCRYVDKNLSRPVLVLHREGDAAYDAKCGPYIQTDPESIEPGSIFVGDHHSLNLLIFHRGQWIRPWITGWLDMRSRTLVGWKLCPLPNSTTISQAFKRAVETYGPPDSVKIDNGKDYASQMFCGITKKQRRILKKGYIDESMVRGIYAMMGVSVSFSIPYHPQSKNIERFFDTFDRQFCTNFTTYCGKNAATKPEGLFDYLNTQAALHEAYSIETLEPLITKYIDAYNRTPHSALNGKAPLEVMESRETKRVCAPGVLDLLLRVWSPELTVGKNGVRFRGLLFGQFNFPLFEHQGKKVRCSYDPNDLRRIEVYDSTTMKFLCIAEQAEMVRYGAAATDEHLRVAMQQKARARKAIKDARGAQRVDRTALPDLAVRAMLDAAKPESKKRKTPRLRPAKTVLDGQVVEHDKAVGRLAAASQRPEPDMVLTWDREEPEREPMVLTWDDFDPDEQAAGDKLLSQWLDVSDCRKKA